MIKKTTLEKTRLQKTRLQKRTAALILLTLLLVHMTMPVMAANVTAVTAQFTILKTIMTTIVSSIGTLVTLWGLFEFGNSMQTQEGGAQSQALKRIGGGLIMTIAPQLLNLFTV